MGPSITDPTIFDNLRVMVEGALYERDLAGELEVVDRQDLVDLASFSRSFRMKVQLPNTANSSEPTVQLELRLSSQFMDFAAEKAASLLEGAKHAEPGCKLEASLYMPVAAAAQTTPNVAELRPEHLYLGALREAGRNVEQLVQDIWQDQQDRPELQLRYHGTLSSARNGVMHLEAVLHFARPFHEENAAIIPDRIDECLAFLAQI